MLLAALPVQAQLTAVHRRGEGLRSSVLWQHENDWLFSDRGYTNGMRLTWLGPEIGADDVRLFSFLTRVLNFTLQPLGTAVDRGQWGLLAGQIMYTPGRFWVAAVRRSDQPFAGWTYGGATARIVGTHDTFEAWAMAGPLGPLSLAGTAQWLVHKYVIRWAPLPRGWINQTNDGIGVMLRGRWQHSLWAVDGDHWRYLDVRSVVDLKLGTVITSAALGGQARFGLMGRHQSPGRLDPALLDAVLGTGRSLPRLVFDALLDDFEMYFQVGILPRLVAYQAFVEGTLWTDNRQTVKKQPGVFEVEAAFVVKLWLIRWSAGIYASTPETKVNRDDGQMHWRLEGGLQW